MDLPDVNILIAAHRPEHPQHTQMRAWLEHLVNGPAAFGMSELAASGFLRIVTNPRAFIDPSPMEDALRFIEPILAQPHCVPIRPGPRHFEIFASLCRNAGVRGALVPDAYFAALAIESGCRWATRDRDFARFDGLDWFDPIAG